MHPDPIHRSPVAGPRPSAVPLVIGVTGAGVAAFALLVSGVAVALISREIATEEGDGSGSFTPQTLLSVHNLLTAVALLLALALIVSGRDAGRTATVWIGVATLPWLALTVIAYIAVSAEERYGRWSGLVQASVVAGLVGGFLALMGLLLAIVFLGIPSGRRWLAAKVLAQGDERWPPAPLRATGGRFGLGAILGIGAGFLLLALIPLSVLGRQEGTDVVITVYAGLLLVLVVVPELLGFVGAMIARGGRRGGAHLARVGGVPLMIGLPLFTLTAVFVAVTPVFSSAEEIAAAPLPVAVVALGCVLVVVASVAATGLYIAGLAGLADPRTERFLRSPAG